MTFPWRDFKKQSHHGLASKKRIGPGRADPVKHQSPLQAVRLQAATGMAGLRAWQMPFPGRPGGHWRDGLQGDKVGHLKSPGWRPADSGQELSILYNWSCPSAREIPTQQNSCPEP